MRPEDLHVNPLYENQLDMKDFSNIFDHNAQGYKFYWFESIIDILPQKSEMTFKEIMCKMIWKAWFSVTEYHLHLGPTREGQQANLIENLILKIEKLPGVKQPMTEEQLNRVIDDNFDLLRDDFNKLSTNVPYRLLSPFIKNRDGEFSWNRTSRLIEYFKKINESTPLPYIILDDTAVNKKVVVNPYWEQVIMDNYPIIKSWIQMEKVRFLQGRNPGVPGIVYKAGDHEQRMRRLEKVRTLWETYSVVTFQPIIDIYSDDRIEKDRLSIDHFVPWSYISNDELWNLTPMDKAENSSKSNRLPNWDRFFPRLSDLQFKLYSAIYSHDEVYHAFDKCRSDNLNAIWASEQLYKKGNSKETFYNILEHNLHPIYDSAKIQGFAEWDGVKVVS